MPRSDWDRAGRSRICGAVKVGHALAKWLQHHIKDDDVALIRYLKSVSAKGQGASVAG